MTRFGEPIGRATWRPNWRERFWVLLGAEVEIEMGFDTTEVLTASVWGRIRVAYQRRFGKPQGVSEGSDG